MRRVCTATKRQSSTGEVCVSLLPLYVSLLGAVVEYPTLSGNIQTTWPETISVNLHRFSLQNYHGNQLVVKCCKHKTTPPRDAGNWVLCSVLVRFLLDFDTSYNED